MKKEYLEFTEVKSKPTFRVVTCEILISVDEEPGLEDIEESLNQEWNAVVIKDVFITDSNENAMKILRSHTV